ncbi:hypothetical protein, partial [Pseudomonas nicosulfuronedens]|uniref:hypothetical protein n=1 Tax=Pseudomonas nicosulfuronedens TaxID=2571105 RepID=UPI001C5550C1
TSMLEGFGGEVILDLDGHGWDSKWQNRLFVGVKLNVESVSPLWFAYFPRHVAEHYRYRSRAPAISRRQYLSRMDRFQHGRSGANFRT